MERKKLEIIKNYIFIDEEFIDSIYSQLFDNCIVEEHIINSIKDKIATKTDISVLLKDVFKYKTYVENEYDIINQYDKKIIYSYEQKLNRIIDIVSRTDSYCTTIAEAKTKCLNTSYLTLINYFDTYFSRYDFRSPEVFQYIQKCGYLEFETGDSPISNNTLITYNIPYDSYTYTDDYYKNSQYRIVMSLNINKLRTSFSDMTSHLAITLRGSNGIIPLGVFGAIRTINDLYYQIIPIAVWI